MGIDPEDVFWVKCSSCGHKYSLMLNTICPECYKWPKRDGSDRMFPDQKRGKDEVK